MNTTLTHSDRTKLIAELNLFPQWRDGDKQGEKAMLRATGLPDDWVGSLYLSGNPHTDASNVVANLEGIGHLIKRPTHRALGALVEHLLEKTPHVEGRLFLVYLIIQYSLVNDPGYQHLLVDRYSLPDHHLAVDELYDLGWTTLQPSFAWQTADISTLERVYRKNAPFLDAVFMEKGTQAACSVCRIETKDSSQLGTGFCIQPDLILTNCHVLTEYEVKTAQVRFGYRRDATGQLVTGRAFRITGELRRSPADSLDYVVLCVEDAPGANSEIGCLKLVAEKPQKGNFAHIIQYPQDRPQQVVLHENYITYVAPDYRRLQYLTNTQHGSSGSPVFNNQWEVIAIHHSGRPYPNSFKNLFTKGNEGIPMVAVIPEIADLL